MPVATYSSEIVTLLSADSQLTAIVTGGIHDFEDAGRKGINRVELFQSFFPNGIQKPTVIIFEDKSISTNEAVDPFTGYRSTVTPINGWILDDGDRGYDDIDKADQRIRQLLDFARISGAFQILWGNTIKNKREPLLRDAAYYSFDCRVYGFSRFS